MAKADDIVWFEFVESKVFSKQVRELSAEVLTDIQADLVHNPERGDIVKGTHGVRKARVADSNWSRERVVVIVTCICILNMPAESTCCIYSAKVTKPTYRRLKRASLAN